MSNNLDQAHREEASNPEEEQRTVQEEHPQQDSSDGEWAIVGVVAFLGGFVGAASNPAEPASGFIVLALIAGGITWMVVTESGGQFVEEVKENYDEAQQQQQKSSSKTNQKRICSNCGWQNPKDNNYCHDCGEKLRL